MVYFLYTIFFLSCVALIASVLLQPGKTDAGALFTSNISSTAFQPRGSQTILSKITIAAATLFMLSALLLAMPALTGSISVLDTVGETPAETAPANDANSNTSAIEANTNANSTATVNSNSAVNTIIVGNTGDTVITSNANTSTGSTNANAANK